MEYTYLTDAGRRAIVLRRLVQLESEHYQHALNLAAIDAATTPDNAEARDANRAATVAAMTAIDDAHAAASAELASIPTAAGADDVQLVAGVPVAATGTEATP